MQIGRWIGFNLEIKTMTEVSVRGHSHKMYAMFLKCFLYIALLTLRGGGV